MTRSKEEKKTRISDEATRDTRLNNKNLKGNDRKLIKIRIEREIQEELWNWVLKQPAESYSCLAENNCS